MNPVQVVVITGSTKGIGYAVATELLKRGQQVVISGRRQEALEQALTTLEARYGDRVAGCLCDVTKPEAHERLWAFACARFGRVDIWVNNAGIAHPQVKAWMLPLDKVQEVVAVNVLGAYYGTRVAIGAMLAQGGGRIYNLEGFGANGRVRAGMTVYGMSKAAAAYLGRSLAAELKGTPVKLITVQPGMVITDLVTAQFDRPEDLERVKPIFNIIASRIAEVAPWLAEQILRPHENGARLEFLPRHKLLWRFVSAPVTRRKVFD